MLVEIYDLNSLQTYATLLNCWKFLKLYRTKFEMVQSNLNGLSLQSRSKDMVKIDRDVTMDNQQPSLTSQIRIIR